MKRQRNLKNIDLIEFESKQREPCPLNQPLGGRDLPCPIDRGALLRLRKWTLQCLKRLKEVIAFHWRQKKASHRQSAFCRQKWGKACQKVVCTQTRDLRLISKFIAVEGLLSLSFLIWDFSNQVHRRCASSHAIHKKALFLRDFLTGNYRQNRAYYETINVRYALVQSRQKVDRLN